MSDIKDSRLSRDLLKMRSGAKKTLRLLYPQSWAPKLHPDAAFINKAVADWLVERGLVTDAHARRIIEELRGDMYGGYPFGWTSRDKCLLVTKALVLWSLFDDFVTETDGGFWKRHGLTVQDFIDAIGAGTLSPGADPFFLAWREIGQGLAPETWRASFAKGFGEWVDGTARERKTYASLLAQDSLPDLDTYLGIRSVTIGMRPTFSLIEFAQGYELSEEMKRSKEVSALHEISARLVFFANDICGLEKERESRWPNIVTIIERQYGCGSFWTTGGLTHGTMLRLGLRPDLEEFFVFGMALPA